MKNFLKSLYVRIFRLSVIIKFKKFGSRSYIGSGASIKGGKKIYIGNNVRLGKFCRMQCYGEFAGKTLSPEIIIGDGCYIGDRFTVLSADKVELDKDVLVASNVTICSENHGIDPTSNLPYKSQALLTKPIFIGKGSWIGQNAVIMPGVKVGKKCVIGASAVVTKDVEDYSMVAGVPAKVIKKYDFSTNEWLNV